MKKYITTTEAEMIATIEIVNSKNCKCDCGDSYALVTDAGEMVVCDSCADYYNN